MPGSATPIVSSPPGTTPQEQSPTTQPSQVNSGGQPKIRNRSPINRPLKPAFRIGKGPRKNVQFAADVVDNEYKMKSRPKYDIRNQQDVLELEQVPPIPFLNPTISRVGVMIKPKANKPVKRDPRPEKSPPHVYRRAKNASDHARGGAKNPPSSYKRKPIPPPVPDPPSSSPRASRPPPAPRPARLPSPDLPEIDGAKMFPSLAWSKISEEFNLLNRPAYQKVDAQLDAAMAFIKESRRGERLGRTD